jgi:hypothetical protein
MSLRQRAYRFADGASAPAGLGGRVDHHGTVLLAAGPDVVVRTLRARAASRPGHLIAGAFLPLRAMGPVIRCGRLAGMDGPFSGRVALITGASGGTGQALARRPATGGAVPGPGYSARGQAAQALAAEITPAGGTAPAIGATCAARRPQSAHPGGRRSAGPG